MSRVVVFVVAILVTGAAVGQELTTDIVDGGSVQTDLGYDIKVNKGSSLHRSFAVINDPAAPAQLSSAGIMTKYGRDRYSFAPVGTLNPSAALSAVEVRFVLYDVFGERIKTLAGTHVVDMPAQSPVSLSEVGTWYAFENEVSELLTVVAFVANARMADGKVWRANEKKLGDALAKLNVKVTSGALEPTKDERPK